MNKRRLNPFATYKVLYQRGIRSLGTADEALGHRGDPSRRCREKRGPTTLLSIAKSQCLQSVVMRSKDVAG